MTARVIKFIDLNHGTTGMIQFAPEPSGREAFDAYLGKLLIADWNSPQGPMQLNAKLELEDLAPSGFFYNTRVLLKALAETNGTATTATGNLTRAFVKQLFDRIRLPKSVRESTLAVCKVINETDAWPLHIARIISECAGLVGRRKNRFQLTRTGRDLLDDEKAGPLFHKLFLAYFLKFDLRYEFRFRDVPGIQQTMAVILWRLDTVARDWIPVSGLAPKVLLPGVLAQMHEVMLPTYDTEEWILTGYVLMPLYELGLLERKEESEWPGIDKKDHVRVTALWRKFITFEGVGR